MGKPILCLDFDGVIHSYESGWKGAHVIPDDPVPGALAFIEQAMEHFEVHVYSSRSGQKGGIFAMQEWMKKHLAADLEDVSPDIINEFVCFRIKWPEEKPPAMVTLDDRAITFTGVFPAMEQLTSFKPWNKIVRPMSKRVG